MSVISPARFSLSSTTFAIRSVARRGTFARNTAVVRTMASLSENPLASWKMGRVAGGGSPDLPKWSSITAEHIRPAITAAVDAATAEIDAIEVRKGWVGEIDAIEGG